MSEEARQEQSPQNHTSLWKKAFSKFWVVFVVAAAVTSAVLFAVLQFAPWAQKAQRPASLPPAAEVVIDSFGWLVVPSSPALTEAEAAQLMAGITVQVINELLGSAVTPAACSPTPSLPATASPSC